MILIGLTPAVEYVATVDAVNRMALNLEEERIDFYIVLYHPYLGY